MQRHRLFGLAYRMLGSVADAEDAVQAAWLKLAERGGGVEHADAYAFRTVTNLCVDRLRVLKARRENYKGPWLPEPWVTRDEPEHSVALKDDLSLAFLLILERLSPDERAVFVLRSAFDFAFRDIAALVGASEQTCRQRHVRAKRKLGRDHAEPPRRDVQRRVLDDLVAAVAAGAVQDLVALLHDDAVLRTDGGGKVSAALVPVTGPERIATILVHLSHKAPAGNAALDYVNVNGQWGAVVRQGDAVHSCTTLHIVGARIREILTVRNPDKLRGALSNPPDMAASASSP